MNATRLATPSVRRPHRLAACARGMLFTLALVVGPFAALASAQKLCVPQASGVPALPGAPNFLDPAAVGPAQYWPRLDDPRWRGALAQTFGTGAAIEASFRALRVDGASAAIYLSWFVPVDSQLDPNFDFVRVAVSPGGGGTDEMIDVIPFTTAAANIQAAAPISTQTRLLVGGAWTNQGSEPTWLGQNTRVWLDVATQMWAVNMRIPIQAGATYNTGISVAPVFNLAFEMQVSQAVGGVRYYRLSNAVSLTNTGAIPAASTWTQLSVEAAPQNCARGVSITSSDVGTTYTDVNNVAHPHNIKINGANTFFVLPTNETGNQIAATRISGMIRIANWGSQPDWNDIPNPTTSLWKQLGSATNAGAINNGATASTAAGNAITFPWTPSVNERCELTGRSGIPANQTADGVAIPGDNACPNQSPTRRLHQCILVELSGGIPGQNPGDPPTPFFFTPQSIYRNMNYVNASTFEEPAEISIAGLAPGGGARDVYLFVQKFRMPADVAAPAPTSSLIDYTEVEKIRDAKGRESLVANTPSPTPTPWPQTPPASGDFATMNQVYPTYLVYVFRDTGATVTQSGRTMKVLNSQSAFGYYVNHQGPLTGWITSLGGATEVAPNYYKVSVPEGGTVTVNTRIEARERGSVDLSGLPWWWWIVLLLLLLFVLILVLRRKTATP